MAITGNKGEWSEIYTLFKLLGDGKLYTGNAHSEKIQDAFFPIVKILRNELHGDFEYAIDQDIVVISSNHHELHRVSLKDFQHQAVFLLQTIRRSSGSFAIPEVEQFMREMHCSTLKAKSSTKTDIVIMVYDEHINQTPTLGFSIKSQLGSASTLLNAGKTTNFKYKIDMNFNASEIDKINAITSKSKVRDRVLAIMDKGGKFEFIATKQRIFENNLTLIDSLLPQLMASMVLKFYTSKQSKVADIVGLMEQENILGFDDSYGHQFYQYKVKRFLTDIALGMMPSKVWTGAYDATGGYLVIKTDGDILCYHIYNRNVFEDYLLNHTKLETASSTRHKFGLLYQENGILFMDLNLQIRFLK